MHLIKDNLVIREATADDAQTLCNWWNDGMIMAHAGYPEGLGTTVQETLDMLQTANGCNHRLILEIDDVAIGEMNFRILAGHCAEIGIKICNFNHHNQGFGSAFLTMLISYLFKQMKIQKVILDTNLKNYRAQHVYEKLGFRKVAVHHDSWRNQLGELQSSVDYELTKENYEMEVSAD
ncbi:GNAT family protein [Paenibacillus sp. FSL L8-0340]|uniref:GNAT family N-acetyltransferase n=1 Tax=Paenibacillus sp. FSL L8-0340 TaxID=2954685 RepID=UPI0031599345